MECRKVEWSEWRVSEYVGMLDLGFFWREDDANHHIIFPPKEAKVWHSNIHAYSPFPALDLFPKFQPLDLSIL